MDGDQVEVHKHADKKEQGQYLAILTKHAWSIKDLVYGKIRLLLLDADVCCDCRLLFLKDRCVSIQPQCTKFLKIIHV